jgi:chromosomal replication initiation ATPase DnaA
MGVGEIMGIEPAQIFDHYRVSEVNLARFAVYMISRDASKLSFPTIGYYLDRDHSTVVYGYWMAKKRIRWDRRFRTILVQSTKLLATGLFTDP